VTRTVLIAIDNAKRELVGCLLLADSLRALGLRSVIGSVLSFPEYHARYRPDVVVWPNAAWDLSEVAKTSIVLVLPSESCNGQPDQVVMHSGTPENPAYPEPVERFFCWGPSMKDILLETGKWREEQLLATGSPATDHWLLPRPLDKGDRPPVGFTTTFRALSNSAHPARTNYFEWIDQAERSGGDGTYYVAPEHAESWLFLEASIARVMISLVRMLAVEGNERMQIRPHPLELEIRYRYLSGISRGRVSVTKRGTISEWLDTISLLVTFMSASALDAVVRGVPVVSLAGVLDPDVLRKMPRRFRYTYEDMLWQMDDLEDAREYVDLAARGKLEPCRDQRGIEKFLAEHFAFPRRRPAAEQVAIEIKNILDGAGRRPRGAGGGRTVRGWRRGLEWACRHVPLAAQGVALARYLHSVTPGQTNVGYTYQPWNLRRGRAARRSAAEIRRAVDTNVESAR
jgi:surface carbohydrate biosynthesis protein